MLLTLRVCGACLSRVAHLLAAVASLLRHLALQLVALQRGSVGQAEVSAHLQQARQDDVKRGPAELSGMEGQMVKRQGR